MIRAALLVHLLSVVFWVGGMAFMLFAVRPALGMLEPPQRASFVAAVLTRFLNAVVIAVVLVLATGFYMTGVAGGTGAMPWWQHAMTGVGIVMTIVFAYVRWRSYPALMRAVDAKAWPDAGARVASIRRLVEFNLMLGTLVIAIVILGR